MSISPFIDFPVYYINNLFTVKESLTEYGWNIQDGAEPATWEFRILSNCVLYSLNSIIKNALWAESTHA